MTLSMDKFEIQVKKVANQFGLKIDPKAKLWQLSVGEQQRVEIIKMLYRDVDVLILDEPTAVLTPQEANDLFNTLRRMAAEGKAIIIITHKLNEVMDVADYITVLRNGKLIGTVSKQNTTKDELTNMMVGQEVSLEINKKQNISDETVLNLKKLNVLGDKGIPALKDVSLTIHAGEILGIAGVAGNGQKELAEVINGLRNAVSGEILLNGKNITNCSPRD
ncbi:MAG: ATP-binding cassette domain-containing protein, partial [Peptococcales bacterium]